MMWWHGLWKINHLGDAWALWLWCLIPIGIVVATSWRRERAGVVVPSVARMRGGVGYVKPMARGWASYGRWVPGAFRVLAFVMFVVAMARPQETSGQQKSTTEGVALQIVFDRSSSMGEPIEDRGTESDKVTVAKRAITQFVAGDGKDLKGREGDMIGMITFARYADTLAPLSRTHSVLLDATKLLKLARPNSGEDGTAIGDALALAAARLKRAEEEVSRTNTAPGAKPDFTIRSKAIVLLTDGENNAGETSPYDAAKLAKEWGIKIYAIGVGGQRMMTVGGMFGDQKVPVGGGADMGLLKSLAELTGGMAFKAEDADALKQAYAAINQLEKTQIQTTSYTNITERYGPFVVAGLAALGVSVLLSATVFRRLP